MYRITHRVPHALHDTAATRRIVSTASAKLAPHELMQRAGKAVARLARAVAPYSRTIWVLCGPGNNGGDGLEAAALLRRDGLRVVVTWLGDPERCSSDALASWHRASAAKVEFATEVPTGLGPDDLCIDALVGLGGNSDRHETHPAFGKSIASLRATLAPILAVDLPSGLHGDTGQFAIDLTSRRPDSARASIAFSARFTITLLTLKPGLFTGCGRDASGEIWFDDLGIDANVGPSAWLSAEPHAAVRSYASNKGDFGLVVVVGGEYAAAKGSAMTGAALLAARAALFAGAGRVAVVLLGDKSITVDPAQPELMFRSKETVDWANATVVCGCGGGEAVSYILPEVIKNARALVLDADALNAIAGNEDIRQKLLDRSRAGRSSVLTPHPLEAARLLGTTVPKVQADRISAAQQLAGRFQCVVVLKGSGTVIAAPDRAPAINPTGNARLATAGTGDVLAGMVGARLAGCSGAFRAAADAVYSHGHIADHWHGNERLVAGGLASSN